MAEELPEGMVKPEGKTPTQSDVPLGQGWLELTAVEMTRATQEREGNRQFRSWDFYKRRDDRQIEGLSAEGQRRPPEKSCFGAGSGFQTIVPVGRSRPPWLP